MAREFPTICGPGTPVQQGWYRCAYPPEPPVPEGLVLIRDSYQFEDAEYTMIGFTPDSDGPHKLIVGLGGTQSAPHSFDNSFTLLRGALERTVTTQGHGVVILDFSGADNYPDFAGAAELFGNPADFSGSRAKVCEEWVRQGTGVIAGINKLCARDDFDCSSGIALFGYSQGAGVAVQTSKLYPGVNALLSTAWAPLLGAGNAVPDSVFEAINPPGGGPYVLPPNPLALHWCGFDDTGTIGNLTTSSGYTGTIGNLLPVLSTFVDKTKRLSVISALDIFGNPTEDPAATAPLFSLQRDFSGYDCPDTQNDCTQADGSGYYVVPAGVVPSYWPGKPSHEEFREAFSDDAFIGEKWHFDAAFKWLGDAAFGAKA